MARAVLSMVEQTEYEQQSFAGEFHGIAPGSRYQSV
jgi:hypothetical protein